MRRILQSVLDVGLILLASAVAFLLKDNFEISAARLVPVLPYFAITLAVSLAILPIAGINRSIWRFTTLPDYIAVMFAVVAVVGISVGAGLAYNGLHGVSRSLPVLQGILGVSFLVGARVAFRAHHSARMARRAAALPLRAGEDAGNETVLLVGLSRLTETYLQSLAELAPGQVRVVGLLGKNDRQVGRLAAAQPILGLPEGIEQVLYDLEVHGVRVDQIVITTARKNLSAEALDKMLELRRSGQVRVRFLAEDLGMEGSQEAGSGTSDPSGAPGGAPPIAHFELSEDELAVLARRPYWPIKRAIDFAGASVLLVLLAPVFLVLTAMVVMAHGFPVAFWQERPGLGGRPFRLFKFRTMRAAQSEDGGKLSDEQRMTRVGTFLRQTRLDELPQLINVLSGDMSFVGPRPLLPRDQSHAHKARLLIRPGLTGWAQVVGGRSISADTKAALDVWYVSHASLALDLEIAVRTVPMVLVGERVFDGLIEGAIRDLRDAGILTGDLDLGGEEPVQAGR